MYLGVKKENSLEEIFGLYFFSEINFTNQIDNKNHYLNENIKIVDNGDYNLYQDGLNNNNLFNYYGEKINSNIYSFIGKISKGNNDGLSGDFILTLPFFIEMDRNNCGDKIDELSPDLRIRLEEIYENELFYVPKKNIKLMKIIRNKFKSISKLLNKFKKIQTKKYEIFVLSIAYQIPVKFIGEDKKVLQKVNDLLSNFNFNNDEYIKVDKIQLLEKQKEIYKFYFNLLNKSDKFYKNTGKIIIKNNFDFDKSLIRYGDGELLKIIKSNVNIKFQKYSDKLREHLINILKSDNLIVALYINYEMDECIEVLNKYSIDYNYLVDGSLFRKNTVLFYLDFYQYLNSKKITLISSDNELLDIFLNIKWVSISAKEFYNDDEKEINNVIEKVKNDDNLILVSGGPGAKVLAYYLINLNKHVIDIGNIELFTEKMKFYSKLI
jgi:hypothetical protein